MRLKNREFNLILSGGAALGYAHVGVCEFLSENSLKPRSYHGVSMGAIIASIEALNLDVSLKSKIYSDIKNVFKWYSFNFFKSLIGFKEIEKIIDSIFKDMKFSDLDEDLFIGATNFENGKYVTFCKKNDHYIKDALLASMAIPGVFPLKLIDNTAYVDGYISSNLPLSSIDNDYVNLIVNVIGKNSFKQSKGEKLLNFNLFKSLDRSFTILIHNQAKMALYNFDKDYILIEPEVHKFKSTSFFKFNSIKEKGYQEMAKVLNLKF